MRIGIIGSGNIGATAARLFAEAGHEVAVSNSRGPETLQRLVEEIGPNARAATVEEAAEFGEVVLEAIPFGRYEELPVEPLAGKVVVDASNYYPQRDGEMDLGDLTHSEAVARHLGPGARVVKAFNTMYYETLASERRPEAPLEERLVLFMAGDDEEAKAVVSRLIEQVGFAPLDTGSLREGGRKQQPGSAIYNEPMTFPRAREALAGTEQMLGGRAGAPMVTYFVRMRAKEGKAEEVRDTLLTNPAIAGEEPGRVVFALHRSRDDPNEFWIYETWESEESVAAHESSEPFLNYRETLRLLVEAESVVWGNTEPFAVKGYDAGP